MEILENRSSIGVKPSATSHSFEQKFVQKFVHSLRVGANFPDHKCFSAVTEPYQKSSQVVTFGNPSSEEQIPQAVRLEEEDLVKTHVILQYNF